MLESNTVTDGSVMDGCKRQRCLALPTSQRIKLSIGKRGFGRRAEAAEKASPLTVARCFFCATQFFPFYEHFGSAVAAATIRRFAIDYPPILNDDEAAKVFPRQVCDWPSHSRPDR